MKNSIRIAACLIMFCAVTGTTPAQNFRIDSLRDVLSQAKGAEQQLQLHLELAEGLQFARPLVSLQHAKNARVLAKRLGRTEDESRALLTMSLVSGLLGNVRGSRRMLEQADSIASSEDIYEQAMIAHLRGNLLTNDGFPERAEPWHHRADSLLRLIPGQRMQVDVINNYASCLSNLGHLERAEKLLEESMALARARNDTSLIAACIFFRSAILPPLENVAEEETPMRLALQLSSSQGDSVTMSAILSNLAGTYLRRGNIALAEEFYRRSVLIAEHISYKRGRLFSTINLAYVLTQRGRLDTALVLLQNTRLLAREVEEPVYEAVSLGLMGNLYDHQRKYEKLLSCSLEAQSILEDLGENNELASAYGTTGIAYWRLGRVDSAEFYLQASMVLDKKFDQTMGLSLSEATYGNVKRLRGQFDSARYYYERAIEDAERTGFMVARIFALNGLTELAIHEKHIATADSLSQLAVHLAEESETVEIIRDAYEIRSRAAAMAGRFHDALDAHRQYVMVKDSLLNEDNLRTINELNAKYEAEQREKQIALLEKGREIKNLELKRQQEELHVRTLEALQREQQIGLLQKDREIQSLEIARRDADLARQEAVTERREHEVRLLRKDKDLQASLLERETFRRNATLVGLAALLLVTGLVFWRYREKQRSNRKLERTLGELRRTQDQLIHTEKMATLGELTAGIAHEIKNPLNFVTNFSTVSTELVEELEEKVQSLSDGDERRAGVFTLLEELKGNMSRIHQHGQRADGIVASMLLHARSQKGVRQQTDINTLLREAVQLAFHGMRAQMPDFTVEIEEEYDTALPKVEVIPQEISRVFLNVLSNAFQAVRKRTQEGKDESYIPVVRVSTRATATGVEVRIRDNGPGIPASIREKIFQPFFTTKPTGEGTGLGLSLSYDIVVKGHGGEISAESEENRYTEIVMSIPGKEMRTRSTARTG